MWRTIGYIFITVYVTIAAFAALVLVGFGHLQSTFENWIMIALSALFMGLAYWTYTEHDTPRLLYPFFVGFAIGGYIIFILYHFSEPIF